MASAHQSTIPNFLSIAKNDSTQKLDNGSSPFINKIAEELLECHKHNIIILLNFSAPGEDQKNAEILLSNIANKNVFIVKSVRIGKSINKDTSH